MADVQRMKLCRSCCPSAGGPRRGHNESPLFYVENAEPQATNFLAGSATAGSSSCLVKLIRLINGCFCFGKRSVNAASPAAPMVEHAYLYYMFTRLCDTRPRTASKAAVGPEHGGDGKTTPATAVECQSPSSATALRLSESTCCWLIGQEALP